MNAPAAPAPLTIVIAPDSFKGSLSAADAAAALAAGVRDVLGAAPRITLCPMADGGEGTLDAISLVWGVDPRRITVTDALGRPRSARYALSADARTGLIEAAEANGLPAVLDVPRQPLRADTAGVGVIARSLLDQGVQEILLCIGGSATTDGGTGLLTALGVRFLGQNGEPVAPGGGGLAEIRSLDLSGLHERARDVVWRVAVDVNNPLCGELGAAAVFGPQKGAEPGDIRRLDAGLANLAVVIAAETGIDTRHLPGAGAAGGMPATLVPLLRAQMVPGSTLVADAVGLAGHLAAADLVLTGEGRFDSQSLGGKVVEAVTRLAPAGCPVVVVAGSVGLSAQQTRAAGVTAAFSLAAGPATLDELTEHAAERLRETAGQVAALFMARQTGPPR
ncbi:MAG: glycerate kinase [Cryobacterium sp.]